MRLESLTDALTGCLAESSFTLGRDHLSLPPPSHSFVSKKAPTWAITVEKTYRAYSKTLPCVISSPWTGPEALDSHVDNHLITSQQIFADDSNEKPSRLRK